MKNTSRVLVCLLSFSLIFSGCLKDVTEIANKIERVDKVVWNPHIAIPLVYSKIGIESLLGKHSNQYLIVKPDKSIEVIYEGNLFSKRANEVFTFPDQNFSVNFSLSAADLSLLNLNDSVEINRNFTFEMIFPGDFEIDSTLINSGNLSISGSSSLRQRATISVGLPDLRKNNASSNLFLDMNYAGSTPVTASNQLNLSQAWLLMNHGTKNHSTIRLNVKVKVYKTTTNPIGANENINLDLKIENVAFRRVHFYAPTFDLRNNSSDFNIGLFDQASGQGSFSLADPRLKLLISNSFGIPVNYSLVKMEGTNTAGNQVNLSGSNVGTILSLPYPGNDYNNVYRDSFEINKNITNIVDYLKNQPYKNEYDFNVFTAPATGQRYWMQDSSVVKFDAQIVVPLHGTIEDVIFDQFQPIDFGISNPEELEEVQIRLYTENGFPIGANLQVYLIDSTTNRILDSLFSGNNTIFLSAADVNSAGRVTTVGKRLIDVTYNKSRVEKLVAANQIRFKANLNTTKDGSGQYKDVKFYSDYDILVQLGVQAKILVKTKL